MAFLPPINMGSFKPSPATLAQWVYDIWQYLQENPIATQDDITAYIQNYFETSPEVQEVVGEVVAQYLLDNPPQAPVQSVQGKTGAVMLNYPDIVPASNAVPVYRAASAPNVSTAQGLYNNGYRLFVNTTTQEIFTISNSGALALVGRGKFDGTTVDLDTTHGDTTIAEAVNENSNSITSLTSSIQTSVTNINTQLTALSRPLIFREVVFSGTIAANARFAQMPENYVPTITDYTPVGVVGYYIWAAGTSSSFARAWVQANRKVDIVVIASEVVGSARTVNGKILVMYAPTDYVDTNASEPSAP